MRVGVLILIILIMVGALLFLISPLTVAILFSFFLWVPVLAHVQIRWRSNQPLSKKDFSELERQGLLEQQNYQVAQACCFNVRSVFIPDSLDAINTIKANGKAFYFFILQDTRLIYLSKNTLKRLGLLNSEHFPCQAITISRHKQTREILEIWPQGESIELQWHDVMPREQAFLHILSMPVIKQQGDAIAGYELEQLETLFNESEYSELAYIEDNPIPPAPLLMATASTEQILEKYYPLRLVYFSDPQNTEHYWIVELNDGVLLHLFGAYLRHADPLQAACIRLARNRSSRDVLQLEHFGPLAAIAINQAQFNTINKVCQMRNGQFSTQYSLDELLGKIRAN